MLNSLHSQLILIWSSLILMGSLLSKQYMGAYYNMKKLTANVSNLAEQNRNHPSFYLWSRVPAHYHSVEEEKTNAFMTYWIHLNIFFHKKHINICSYRENCNVHYLSFPFTHLGRVCCFSLCKIWICKTFYGLFFLNCIFKAFYNIS